ncbi:hypothetical protein N8S91_01565 [Enterobacter roggenkampii]|uniref:hypothetical protein n=1 Tax=Enterobacter roggenkampii TaxID=1812935 RepID=UPI0021C62544|nr:hypothetical protein [Enterobacter roggenkampii]MCU2541889.1 hypothetical protein [Enterobacter roggenkampii]MCU3048665.1 hypothetical protein [Enterobacter roggenkampii]MCU3109655.1 hypothetical protein [Enterobacter roggenkampii]MCU3817882.1 hypothetical protein [Enterobacter roggenkampii]
MIKILSLRLKHCNALANSMSNASPTQLQQFKTQLSEQMGKPVGLHTMGIPAAISTLGVIVSFAIPQLWLGYGVLAALSQPAERVFVWVVLVALLFAGINGVTMFMIGKGSMRAVRIHLALAVISLVLTAAYLLAALIGSPFPGVSLTAALVSIVMLLLSARMKIARRTRGQGIPEAACQTTTTATHRYGGTHCPFAPLQNRLDKPE